MTLDKTTKMSYHPSTDPGIPENVSVVMIGPESDLTSSVTICCLCEHELSTQELEDFYRATDEDLHGEVYCHSCMEQHLALCRECSARYTAAEVCGGCRR